MKVVLLLLCLVLIQIFSAGAEDQNTELSRDATVGMDRQVREAGQKVKNKSSKKEMKEKKNAKVSRKNKSKPSRKKANGRTNKSKPRGKKMSKKANGRTNKSKPRGKKKSKKANKRKNKSKPRRNKKSKRANERKNKSKPRGKKKSRKANGRKNKSKPRGKKNSKKANGGKNKSKPRRKKKSKKCGGRKICKKKRSKKRKSGGKLSKTARENDAECFGNLCEKSKKFNLYQTQLRKATRIQKWVDLMGNKKEKAMTTFKNASSAITKATLNGTQCDGGSIPPEVKVAYETLENCSTTASELCDSSGIPGLDTSLITECEPKLQNYIDGYKKCLKICDCSCFTDLPIVDDSCTKFNDMESNTKVARKKCIKPTEKGSFGDCRQQERLVAYYGEKCKFCPASMTTKATSVVARKQREFQRLAGRM